MKLNFAKKVKRFFINYFPRDCISQHQKFKRSTSDSMKFNIAKKDKEIAIRRFLLFVCQAGSSGDQGILISVHCLVLQTSFSGFCRNQSIVLFCRHPFPDFAEASPLSNFIDILFRILWKSVHCLILKKSFSGLNLFRSLAVETPGNHQ